jgi:hypothetical protein
MKKTILLMGLPILFSSCGKDYYGTYNTNHLRDKTAFYEIKLNSDHTAEKTQIHTIGIIAKGNFLVKGKQVVCFFDSAINNFGFDTLVFKVRGKKLFFVKNGVVRKRMFLLKQ